MKEIAINDGSVQRFLGKHSIAGIAVTLATIAVKTKDMVDFGLIGLALINIAGFGGIIKKLIMAI